MMKGFNDIPWVRNIWRNITQFVLPVEQADGNKTKRWLTITATGIAITVVIVLAGNQYVNANKIAYYNVYVGDEEIGSVENPIQIEQLFSQKRQEYQNKYPNVEMVLQTEDVTTKVEVAFKAEVDSEPTLKKLDGMLSAYAKGVELKIDGKVVAIVKDQETVDDILNQVKQQYLPEAEKKQLQVKMMSGSIPASKVSVASAPESTVKSVDIVEKVDVTPITTEPDQILSLEEVTSLLTETNEAPIVYTIEEGDTLSSIVKRYDITEKQIYSNNPDIVEKYLQIGDTLKLTVPKLPVTVTTLEQVSEEIVTAPKVEIRKTAELEAGKSKVVRPGQEGLKVMEYLVTKENGQVVDEQWLSQDVIKESVTEVVLQGTKIAGQGSGQFAWPVSGATISSTYGSRWGKQHKGIDLVSGNRTIMAADEGVVTFTGNISGYGKAVIINHSNGYTTLYGHLRSFSVNQGQTVSKGSGIGVMGNTGRSTGTHLHFEILKNDVAQNPMKYLN
ncbi:peptidoglycan DD-metalloendopeptidase family protein [Paenibacillus sp. FA6]|uniref:peptidoglycan DD-metalloendopeptidase family protein n=1 Tax=Paenibacillus sp. FA6 TaxID=3413029 RepID=UPI003F65A72E